MAQCHDQNVAILDQILNDIPITANVNQQFTPLRRAIRNRTPDMWMLEQRMDVATNGFQNTLGRWLIFPRYELIGPLKASNCICRPDYV